MKTGQLIDAFFAYLVGLTIVVMAMAMNYFGGSGTGVIAGFVALGSAYVVNMIGGSGLRIGRTACAFAYLCWLATVATVVAAILCVI